jgi:Ferredoxin
MMRKRKMSPEPNLTRPASKADLDAIAARWHAEQQGKKHQLLVCAGAGCVSSGCHAVKHALLAALKDAGLEKETAVHETGCLGSCHLGPTLVVQPDGVLYTELKPEHMKGIVRQHLVHREVVEQHCWVDPRRRSPSPPLRHRVLQAPGEDRDGPLRLDAVRLDRGLRRLRRLPGSGRRSRR